MTELNYDEKWITELKQEVKGLKEENEKLEAKIAKFKKILTDE
jgi:cell division protein FtsB